MGAAEAAILRALRELERIGLRIVAQSEVVVSTPLGTRRQPAFHNMVAGIEGSTSPAMLLRRLKQLEQQAGRKTGRRWGPRPLDIDILTFPGWRCGHPAKATRPWSLIVPHPQMTRRSFVLHPLSRVAPGWRHPILGVSAADLLRRQPALRRGIAVVPLPGHSR